MDMQEIAEGFEGQDITLDAPLGGCVYRLGSDAPSEPVTLLDERFVLGPTWQDVNGEGYCELKPVLGEFDEDDGTRYRVRIQALLSRIDQATVERCLMNVIRRTADSAHETDAEKFDHLIELIDWWIAWRISGPQRASLPDFLKSRRTSEVLV